VEPVDPWTLGPLDPFLVKLLGPLNVTLLKRTLTYQLPTTSAVLLLVSLSKVFRQNFPSSLPQSLLRRIRRTITEPLDYQHSPTLLNGMWNLANTRTTFFILYRGKIYHRHMFLCLPINLPLVPEI
jgi:hypothetical protein